MSKAEALRHEVQIKAARVSGVLRGLAVSGRLTAEDAALAWDASEEYSKAVDAYIDEILGRTPE